mmetsp:Transcript_79972/g.141121  ORF Transcript_79972/g.141121 Transcript_79972/m.141121 type:complete len:202 (-) Transcript_79972:2488-3093(-)
MISAASSAVSMLAMVSERVETMSEAASASATSFTISKSTFTVVANLLPSLSTKEKDTVTSSGSAPACLAIAFFTPALAASSSMNAAGLSKVNMALPVTFTVVFFSTGSLSGDSPSLVSSSPSALFSPSSTLSSFFSGVLVVNSTSREVSLSPSSSPSSMLSPSENVVVVNLFDNLSTSKARYPLTSTNSPAAQVPAALPYI